MQDIQATALRSDILADQLFRANRFCVIFELIEPLDLNKKCLRSECEKTVFERIMFLVVSTGVVVEADLCQEHAASYGGKEFPRFPPELRERWLRSAGASSLFEKVAKGYGP
ncbi:MAG: hypothetical protein AAB487_01980 [Patescibacteria group bacterium]